MHDRGCIVRACTPPLVTPPRKTPQQSRQVSPASLPPNHSRRFTL
jgi:hypothetical protein